jgi:enoyl-CoA hydratase/carnithine racemase
LMPSSSEQPVSVEQPAVLTSVDQGIATLTLNRPTHYNALSVSMLTALQLALTAVAARSGVRVIVLAATGRAFCAGHDLREMRANPNTAWQRALFDQCSALMLSLGSISQPVIAQVQGVATAAGCQLVAACDLAIASIDARFATSGIGLGLFCSTPAVALTRTLSAKHAAELLFTGDFIDATRAQEIGLVNRVVNADALVETTLSMAMRIGSHSFNAVDSGKRLLRSIQGQTLSDAYLQASLAMARDMSSNDARIGIDAFLAKAGTPNWTHR